MELDTAMVGNSILANIVYTNVILNVFTYH